MLKKINYKRILKIAAWTMCLCGLSFSLAFVNKTEGETIVKNISIQIKNNSVNPFITETDIIDFFNTRKDSLLNNKLKNLNMLLLEKTLNSHPAIQKADVAADINGEIKINIIQRTPILRLINTDGESYYIDTEGKPMPLNENYTARVIVASGNINEPYSRRNEWGFDYLNKNQKLKTITIIDDLFELGKFINADSTLLDLVQQININSQNEIELFPAIGRQTIVLGDCNNLNEKFQKLKLFYKEGLNKTNAWNKYSKINLKYKNIVVATKAV
ncbi:MAG: hypothetical protein JSU07_07235 [Bacteroidetes bacterium]|nr:hypothetical protein [Bacteroidota bacterium]